MKLQQAKGLMNYYYALNGQQVGPVSAEQLQALYAAGTINAATLVWREGMADWVAYSTVAELNGGASASAAGGVVCSVCHQVFPPDQTIKYGTVTVCAGCKPKFVQGLREGAVSTAGALELATIGARFGAKLIDQLILGLPQIVIVVSIAMGNANNPAAVQKMANIMQALGLIIGVTYQTLMLGWRGQTLGKMATGIKVVNPDGSPISYGKAFGRALAEILSGCTCMIGYLIAIWDDEKRTLHDRLASTRVVKVQK